MFKRILLKRCIFFNTYLLQKKPNFQRYLNTVFAIPKCSKNTERWNSAIEEAMNLVSYKKSNAFFTEPFENAENDTIAGQLAVKLLRSNHPMLDSVRSLLYDMRLTYQLHGIVVLLLAKALGHTSTSPDYQYSLKHGGISDQQRRLSEILELYRSSFVMHSNILNISKEKDGNINASIQKANAVGILLGDYLAANASVIASELRDNTVLELIAMGVLDFTVSAFYTEMDKNGNSLPDINNPMDIWKKKTFLSQASLLAKGCQVVAHLGGYNTEMQMNAFEFAKNLALALKINTDVEHFNALSNYRPGIPFNLELAPVIAHLNQDKEMLRYIHENGKADVNYLNFAQLFDAVNSGKGREISLTLLNDHITKGLKNIQNFRADANANRLLVELMESLRMK